MVGQVFLGLSLTSLVLLVRNQPFASNVLYQTFEKSNPPPRTCEIGILLDVAGGI